MRVGLSVLAACMAAWAFATPVAAQDAEHSFQYVVRYDHWTDADERAYSEFIQAIGDSQCRTVDSCLHGSWNPFAAGDSDDVTNSVNGYSLLNVVRDAVSSASYRIHPDVETPYEPDMYSPLIQPKSIRPGTMVYDP